MWSKLNKASAGGAVAAIAASIFWLGVNFLSIKEISGVKLVAHSYFDLHILLHLSLIAFMIWLEFAIGVWLLRWLIGADFARPFLDKWWVKALCGPGAALAVIAILVATLWCTGCIGSVGGPCEVGTIVYDIPRLGSIQFREWHIVLLIGLIALVMRTYAWVLHASEMSIEAQSPSSRGALPRVTKPQDLWCQK